MSTKLEYVTGLKVFEISSKFKILKNPTVMAMYETHVASKHKQRVGNKFLTVCHHCFTVTVSGSCSLMKYAHVCFLAKMLFPAHMCG